MINLAEKLDEETAKRIRISAHPTNKASEIGWVDHCKRYLVIARTNTQDQEMHDLGLQRIFDEGHSHHWLMKREIEDAGFKFIERERDFPPNDYELSGHIDGQVRIDGKFVPIELKSCSPNVFRTVSTYKTASELLECKHLWIQRYVGQISAYLFLLGKDEGIILFKDKSSGRKHQIDVSLNYEYVEHLLDELVDINRMVKKKSPPKPEMVDACKMCSFAKTMCFVGQDYGPGFDLMASELIEEKLKRYYSLYPTKKEYDALDEELKAGFRGRSVIIGDFKISSTSHMRGEKEVVRTKIEKL